MGRESLILIRCRAVIRCEQFPNILKPEVSNHSLEAIRAGALMPQ